MPASPQEGDRKHARGVAGGKSAPQEPKEPAPALRQRKVSAQRPAKESASASSSTTTSSSSTPSGVLPRSVLQTLAQSLHQRASIEADQRLMTECEAELTHLGPRLKRPLDLRVVEQLTDRVIDTLAKATTLNLGSALCTLVDALDGRDIGEPALRAVFARLLARGPDKLREDTLTEALRSTIVGLGDQAMPEPLRQVLLECLVERLDSAPRPDQDLVDTCVTVLTEATVGDTFLGEVAARAVAAGSTGSFAARASLLQALSNRVADLHGPDQRGAVYLTLVREAAPLDPKMARAIGSSFHFDAMLKEPGGTQDAHARIEAWFAGLADWALTLDSDLCFELLKGAGEGLWSDTECSPSHLRAALGGLLSGAAPGRELALARGISGLVGDAVFRHRLQPGHVTAILDLLEDIPLQTAGDMRAGYTLRILGDSIARRVWPAGITRALIDGILQRAPKWPTGRAYQAGRILGESLAEMAPDSAPFIETVGRMAQLEPLDRATRLLCGFAAGMMVEMNAKAALAAFGHALSQERVAGTVRAWVLAAAIDVGLVAGCPSRHGMKEWKEHLRGLAQSPPGQPSGTPAFAILARAAGLVDDPVATVLASGLPREAQQELLEFAWTELCFPTDELMLRQVVHLRDAPLHGDEAARADMLLALFQHAGSVASGETFLQARNVMISGLMRLHAKGASEDGKRQDVKGVGRETADALETGGSQLDALYRYYILASAPPSYLLNPKPAEVGRRLRWLEGVHARSGQKIAREERMVLQAVRGDYAFLFEPQPAVSEATSTSSSTSTTTASPTVSSDTGSSQPPAR